MKVRVLHQNVKAIPETGKMRRDVITVDASNGICVLGIHESSPLFKEVKDDTREIDLSTYVTPRSFRKIEFTSFVRATFK